MLIAAGVHPIWPGFSLENQQEIELLPGRSYHLRGSNGSGKSSFLKQLVLPGLLAGRQDHFLLYFEQQMHKQLYALKAGAALAGYPHQIECEADAVNFLLSDLEAALKQQKRKVFALCDESPLLDLIRNRLSQLETPFCLLFSSHADAPVQTGHVIEFGSVDQHLSRFYESNS